MAEVVLTLRMSDEEADVLLADVVAHKKRDDTDGHRDYGVLLISADSVESAVKREED